MAFSHNFLSSGRSESTHSLKEGFFGLPFGLPDSPFRHGLPTVYPLFFSPLKTKKAKARTFFSSYASPRCSSACVWTSKLRYRYLLKFSQVLPALSFRHIEDDDFALLNLKMNLAPSLTQECA